MNTARIRTSTRSGFTLVELIAVMVVLAVLAGVAIPKYFDYADRARTAALSGALGGVRTGLANFYTDSSFNGTAAYPTFAEITTQGTVMQEAIPDNPYNSLNNVAQITVLLDAQNRVVANPTTVGWNYYVDNTASPPIAIFWANSSSNTTATDNAGATITANNM